MRRASTQRRRVERLSLGRGGAYGRRAHRDMLAVEEPLEIRVAAAGQPARPLSITMRTPGADFELAAGFLHGERVIDASAQIRAIRYCLGGAAAQRYNVVSVDLADGVAFDADAMRRNVFTSSSCGVCGLASIEAVWDGACSPLDGGPVLEAAALPAMAAAVRGAQVVFERTGGLHAAALFSAEGELLHTREDVGRHNAMDKLVGASLLADQLPWDRHVVLLSGRLSFELVQKAARAGARVLAGVSAPSSLAVELAERAGITLIGFLRDDRFNIYTGGHRVRAGGGAIAEEGVVWEASG
jgi:FdhD protein